MHFSATANSASPTLGDSHDKFRTINPQFPSCLSLHGDDDLCGMTIAIVQSNFFSHSSPAVGGVVEKNSAKQFLLIYFPVAKIFTIAERFVLVFRSVHCGLGQEGRRRRKTVKNLWSHFGIITIYCSWMIFKFFIRANKHKNMFLYFHFHGNDFSFFGKKSQRDSLGISFLHELNVSLLSICFGMAKFASVFRSEDDPTRVFVSNNHVCHNSLDSWWRKRKISIIEQKLFINFVAC